MSSETKMMIKNDKVYDILKHTARVVLPAFGTLYFALSQIWGLPFGEEVVGTIVAVDAFLGVALTVSSSAYNSSDAKFDGSIVVEEGPDKTQFNLVLDGDPYDLVDKDEVIFRVKDPFAT